MRQGLFGLGELDEAGQPKCLYFREEPSVGLQGREVLIRAEVCAQQQADQTTPSVYPTRPDTTLEGVSESVAAVMSSTTTTPAVPTFRQAARRAMTLKFNLPFGQASKLLGLLNLLQQRFRRVQITIQMEDGEISEAETEDKVRETFRQIGTDVEIE